MTQVPATSAGLTIDEMPWQDIELPPTDLPYDDGDKMESPWHAHNPMLLEAGYIAARGGRRDDYYIGVNMFVYYSMRQVRNQDYKGPDVFLVKNVGGAAGRRSGGASGGSRSRIEAPEVVGWLLREPRRLPWARTIVSST